MPPDEAARDEGASEDERSTTREQRSESTDGATGAEGASVQPTEDTVPSDGAPKDEIDDLFDVPDIVVGQYVSDHRLEGSARHRRVRATAVVGLTAAAGAVWIGAVATFSSSARHEIGQVIRTVPGGDKLAPAAAPEPATSSPPTTSAHSSAPPSTGSAAPSVGGLNIAAALQPAIYQASASSSPATRADVRHRPLPDTQSSPGHGGVTAPGGGVTVPGGGTTPGGGTPTPPPPVVSTGSPTGHGGGGWGGTGGSPTGNPTTPPTTTPPTDPPTTDPPPTVPPTTVPPTTVPPPTDPPTTTQAPPTTAPPTTTPTTDSGSPTDPGLPTDPGSPTDTVTVTPTDTATP
jgi:hypothetical protein